MKANIDLPAFRHHSIYRDLQLPSCLNGFSLTETLLVLLILLLCSSLLFSASGLYRRLQPDRIPHQLDE